MMEGENKKISFVFHVKIQASGVAAVRSVVQHCLCWLYPICARFPFAAFTGTIPTALFSQLWYQAAEMWAAKLCPAYKCIFPPLLYRQQLSYFGKEKITAKGVRSWDRQQLGQLFTTWCENFQISRTTYKFCPESIKSPKWNWKLFLNSYYILYIWSEILPWCY